MNAKWLTLALCLTLPASIFACSSGTPQADTPPPPTAEPVATAPASAEPAPTVAPSASAAVEPPPAPAKPGKEKIVGAWQFSFEGEPKAKAEAEAKKKFPKDKDQAKRDAYLKKVEEEAAGEWIEFNDGHYVSHTTVKGKDKVVLKIKYDVTKDDNTALTMKPVGKDEISKKEIKDEVTLTFVDDNTIHMVDPKKKMTLVFKRK